MEKTREIIRKFFDTIYVILKNVLITIGFVLLLSIFGVVFMFVIPWLELAYLAIIDSPKYYETRCTLGYDMYDGYAVMSWEEETSRCCAKMIATDGFRFDKCVEYDDRYSLPEEYKKLDNK